MKLLIHFGSLLFFAGKAVAPGINNCNAATYSWPLGPNITNYEVFQSTPRLSMGTVAYGSGPLDYSAMQFLASPNSFADLYIQDGIAVIEASSSDYSIQMYIYGNSVASGTIFHYKGDGAELVGDPLSIITEIRAYMQAGGIAIEYTNFGTKVFDTKLTANTWHHFIFEQDFSNTRTNVFIDRGGGIALDFDNAIADKDTLFPGTLRIGASFDGVTPPLDGRVACVQTIPGREPFPCVDHDVDCLSSIWVVPSTTTTTTEPTTTTTTFEQTTTTTTTEPTTTTTTLEPITTTTTTEPTTTTTTLEPTTTTTTTEPTTTTTTLEPITTTTTTEPTTTTTTLEPTTTTTTTEPTTSTSNTNLPTTSAAISTNLTVTSGTSIVATGTSSITTAQPIEAAKCTRFTATFNDMGFATPTDVISVSLVKTFSACAVECTKNGSCMMFAAKQFSIDIECTLAFSTGDFAGNIGSSIFTLL